MPSLPPATDYTNSSITQGQKKTFMTSVRAYLAGLLGDTGTQSTALTTLGALLNGSTSKAGAYTVVAADRGKLIDCTTGTWTLGIDAAATLGDGFAFGVRNSGTGVITLNPNLSELIDGASTVQLTPGASCLVLVDGGALKTVGRTAMPDQAGNSGKFLTTNGTDVSWADPAWKLISSVPATAVAAIDFTLDRGTYGAFLFVIDEVAPALDGYGLIALMGYASGSSFQSGISPVFLASNIDGEATDMLAGGRNGTTDMYVGNAAGEHASSVLMIAGLSSSSNCGYVMDFRSTWIDAANSSRNSVAVMRNGATERAWDTLRFAWKDRLGNSSNFQAAGTITLYGLVR